MIGSQILGGMFGDKEQTPSIIFNAQTTEWGSTDSSRRADDGGNKREGFEYHAKTGAKMKHGEPIATALAVATNAFTTIEATLASFGDGYVDMLDGAVIEFGRKTKGVAGGSWDFGSEKDMDKLLEEYAGKLQDAIPASRRRCIYRSWAGTSPQVTTQWVRSGCLPINPRPSLSPYRMSSRLACSLVMSKPTSRSFRVSSHGPDHCSDMGCGSTPPPTI